MRTRDCGEICKKMSDAELLAIPKLIDEKDYYLKGKNPESY
ncbi:MAG: hypothetical protein QXF07_01370 [Candidatus Micrarchaeia archaeon]